ncbi:DUF368 domain-containing protein [Anaeropeptidivorans aminofermentans]|jgi:putative membrane protein|uniref:DUF368 domain-containing protein n=1 Tax=Anaeropeptidivorans aminofermentans TaxID=2934315 RepID=UPI0020241EAD|nr:DUF368 domain-containing protein [Anaeropeptidivorans aminofermentans]MBE6012194.1 DUF368 domain-containing protein [Lachnospiraceae bacterium]
MNLVNAIKGFFIGIALVIPGLSGSIFAVVVGLYEGILEAVNNISKDFKSSVKFLMPIAVGAVVGILASTKAILWVCQEYPVWSYLFFIGLVAGSVPLVLKKINLIKFNPLYLLITVGSFIAILYITALGNTGGSTSYIAIERLNSPGDFFTMVFAGVFSVSLMAIPGVSGSVMLMVINQYGTVYNAVGTCLDLVSYLIKGNMAMAQESFFTVLLVLPFLIGAIGGFVFIAKIMGYLLKHFEAQVYYGVAGVVLAAVVTLAGDGVVKNLNTLSFAGNTPLILVLGTAFVVVGFLCTVFLDKP